MYNNDITIYFTITPLLHHPIKNTEYYSPHTWGHILTPDFNQIFNYYTPQKSFGTNPNDKSIDDLQLIIDQDVTKHQRPKEHALIVWQGYHRVCKHDYRILSTTDAIELSHYLKQYTPKPKPYKHKTTPRSKHSFSRKHTAQHTLSYYTQLKKNAALKDEQHDCWTKYRKPIKARLLTTRLNDYDYDYKKSTRSWKQQRKTRHQYKTKDNPESWSSHTSSKQFLKQYYTAQTLLITETEDELCEVHTNI